MKNMLRLSFLFLISLLLIHKGSAATITITTNTNWSAINSGSGPGGQPNASDIINVTASGSNVTLTVDIASAVCGNITMQGGSAVSSTLAIGANSLTAATVTLTGGSSSTSNATVSISSGSLLCSAFTMTDAGSTNRVAQLLVTSTGSVTCSGTFATGQRSIINYSGAGALNLGGAITFPGSNYPIFTLTSATVNYYASGPQTIGLVSSTTTGTYFNLTLSGSGVKTFPATTITVNGTLSMQGTATATVSGTLAYGTNAALEYKGSSSQTTGPEFLNTFPATAANGTGGVIINNPNGVTLSGPKTINSSSKVVLTSGILTTTSTNLLTINNRTAGGMSGGNSTSYIDGPVAWNSGSTGASTKYSFIVGSGAQYLPLDYTFTTANNRAITVQAIGSNPGGTVDATLSGISNTEYWTLALSGTVTTGQVSLGKSSLGTFNTIGRNNTSANSQYTAAGGSTGQTVGSINGIGMSNSFAIAATTYYLALANLPLGPTLNAAANQTVDNNFNITFVDNATWRAAVTGIIIDGVTYLAASGVYSLTAGSLDLTTSSIPQLQVAGSHTIQVVATGYSNNSVTQTNIAGADAKLALTQQPTAPATNGDALGTQPIVRILDQYNNLTASTAVVTANVGAGVWTIGGTAVNAVAGVATFTDLTATSALAVTGATIDFTSPGLTNVISGTFNIPGPAGPVLSAAAGQSVDNDFNITFPDDASWRAAVTSIIVDGVSYTTDYILSAGSLVLSTSAITQLQTAGSHTIQVVATGYLNSSVTQTNIPGVATYLAMSTQPTAPATNGGTLASQPIVVFKDQYNNTTSTGAGTITAAVTSPQAWTLGGTLTADGTSNTATFSGLTAGTAGLIQLAGATITFSAPGVTDVISNSFTIPPYQSNNTDQFRSFTTGTWGTASNWESSPDGTNWYTATLSPNNNSSGITILTGHTMTVASSVSIDQTTINSGGQVNINSGVTLTVANGTGTDLTVNGYLRNSGTLTTAGATVSVSGATATYEHNLNNLTIPANFTWASNSTLLLNGSYTGAGTAVLTAGAYQNVFWAGTVNAAADYASLDAAITIAGKLTASGTGSGALLTTGGTNTSPTIAEYEQTSGNVFINRNSGSPRSLTVTGNVTISGGTLFVKTLGSAGQGQFNIGGNLTIGSGATIANNGTAGSATVFFTGVNNPQLFSNAGNFNYSGSGSSIAITVNSAAIVDFGTSNFGTSTNPISFTSQTGSTIKTANASGLNGTINVAGTKTLHAATNYEFNGTSAQVTGALLTAANNLVINNTAGVTLSAAASVNGILTLTNGLLDLGVNNLTLANAVTPGSPFSSSNMIVTSGIGEVRHTTTGLGSYTFPIGDNTGTVDYTPITVNITAGSGFASAYVGASVVNATHSSVSNPTNNLSRYWNINQSGITGMTADVTGSYLPTDVTGAEGTLNAAQLNGAYVPVTNGWYKFGMLGGNTLSATGATITAGTTSAFSGVPDEVLPVELLSFNVLRYEDMAKLQWRVAQEINFSHYAVYSSSNGIDFELIGNVPARGSDNYYFIDDRKTNERVYYKLKMIDIDGSFEYSPIRTIGGSNRNLISIYPNPCIDFFNIDLIGYQSEKVFVKIVNAGGSIVYEETYSNIQTVNISTDSLPSGYYFVLINTDEGLKSFPLSIVK